MNNSVFKGEKRQYLLKWGTLPHLVRRSPAKISLRLEGGSRPEVKALRLDGTVYGNVKSNFSNGVLHFTADPGLFRGGVMNLLHRAGYSPKAMIVWSALLFGLFHINPAQIPFAFLLGLLLGWLYHRTGSLLPGLLCHFINNALGAMTLRSGHADARLEEMVGGPSMLWAGIAVGVVVFLVSLRYLLKVTKPDAPGRG